MCPLVQHVILMFRTSLPVFLLLPRSERLGRFSAKNFLCFARRQSLTFCPMWMGNTGRQWGHTTGKSQVQTVIPYISSHNLLNANTEPLVKRFTNSQLHRKYVRGILICFVMTPKRWIESTGAIGIISKPVRYGAACSAMSTGPFAKMRYSFTLFANRFSRIYLSSAASLRHHLLRLTPGIRSAYLQFVLVGNWRPRRLVSR